MNQQFILKAKLMENYDRTMELVETAQNSAGKSDIQFGKYTDTLQYKVNQLNGSWEKLRQNFLQSEFLKNTVDLFGSLVENISDLDTTELLSIGILGLTVGKTFVKNFLTELQKGVVQISSTFKNIKKNMLTGTGETTISAPTSLGNLTSVQASEYGKIVSYQNEIAKKEKEIEQIQNRIKKLNEQDALKEQEKVNKLQEQIDKKKQLATESSKALAKDIDDENISGEKIYKTAYEQSDRSKLQNRKELGKTLKKGVGQSVTGALTAGAITAITTGDLKSTGYAMGTTLVAGMIPSLTQGLSSLLSSSAIAGPIGIAVAAVGALTAGVAIWSKKQNEANKKAEQAELKRLDNVADTNNTLAEDQSRSLGNIKQSYSSEEKLKKDIETYNKYSNQTFLTEQSQKKLDDAIEDLNTNFSNVINYYDEQTNTLDINTNAVENLTAEMEETRKSNLYQIGLSGAQIQSNLKFQESKTNQILKDLSNVGYLKKSNVQETNVAAEAISWVIPGAEPLTPLLRHTQYSGKGDYSYTDEFRNAYTSSVEDVQQDILSSFSSLTDELQSEIFTKLLDQTNIQISSYDELVQKIDEGSLSLERFSDVISTITYSNFDEQSKAWQENATQYFKGLSSDTLNITDQFAKVLAQSADYAAAKIEDTTYYSGTGELKTSKKERAGYKSRWGILKDLLNEENTKDLLSFLGTTPNKITESGTNLVDWDNLTQQMQQAIQTAVGDTNFGRDDWENIRKDAEKTYDILIKVFANAAQQKGLQGQTGDIYSALQNEDIGKIITSYQGIIDQAGTLTEAEFENKINGIINQLENSAVVGAQDIANDIRMSLENVDFSDMPKQQHEEYNKQLKEIFGDDTLYKDWALDTKTAIINSFKENSFTDDQRQKIAQVYMNVLNSVPSYLQSQISNILSQIDLTQGLGSLYQNKDEIITLLKQAGLSTEDAQKTYANFIENGTEAIRTALTSPAGLQAAYDKYVEFLNNQVDLNKNIVEAIQKWASDDLDLSSMEVLFENLPDEVLTLDSNLNIDISSEAAKEILQPVVASLSETLNNLIAAKTYKNVAIKAIGTSQESQYDKAISDYSANKDRYEDITDYISKNAKIVKGLDAGILVDMAKNGSASLSEYNDQLSQTLSKAPEEIRKAYALTNQMIEDAFGNEEENEKNLLKAKNNLKKAEKDLEKAKRDRIKADKDLKKAEDDLAKAEKDLLKAEKERYEAYYGSEFYNSSLDDLYNYTQMLQNYNDQLEKNNNLLSDTTTIATAAQVWNDYANSIHNSIAAQEAQNEKYKELASQNTQQLLEKYGQYFSVDDFGKLVPDISYLEDALIPDDEKKFIEEQISLVNEYVDASVSGDKEVYEKKKEYQDKLKQLYKDYVSLEDNIADVLKKQAEDQVDTQKDKYDKLKEADDDYLDALEEAINRQRKLRDQENEYEDLAQKQKKLSLLQRDTSGANQKEALQLEKEVQQDQENLLDTAVDNIIENMKSLQETQQELRDAEVELKEAVIEETNWSKEAAAILSTFQTSEDYVGWMTTNDPDFQEMSMEKQSVQIMDWEEQGKILVQYLTSQTENIQSAVETSPNEILNIIQNISEGATGALERDYLSMKENVKQAQEEADQSVQDAKNSVSDAKDAILDAKDAIVNADIAIDDAKAGLGDARKELIAAQEKTALFNGSLKDLNEVIGSPTEAIQKFLSAKAGNSTGQTVSTNSAGGSPLPIGPTDLSSIIRSKKIQMAKTQYGYEIGAANSSKYDSYNYAVNMGNQKFVYFKASSTNASSTIQEIIDKLKATGQLNKNSKYDVYKLSPNSSWSDGGRRSFDPRKGYTYYSSYKDGGYVNYTGPAWVDGTKTKPEAFLNAEDTANIRSMMDIMDVFINGISSLSKNNYETNNQTISPNIEVNINVDSISNDYDVDQVADRVKKNILDAYNTTGNSVIIRK